MLARIFPVERASCRRFSASCESPRWGWALSEAQVSVGEKSGAIERTAEQGVRSPAKTSGWKSSVARRGLTQFAGPLPWKYSFEESLAMTPAEKSPELRRRALDLVHMGEPVAKVTKGLGISEGTLRRRMAQDHVDPERVKGLTTAVKR